MRTLTDLIVEQGLLKELDPSKIETISGCGKNAVFEAGAYIQKEGDPADHFYLVRAGKASLETFIPGRGNVIFKTLSEGDLVGVSWLVPPYRSSFDARALEECRAIEFDANCLRQHCEADHDLGYALLMKFVPVILDRMRSARLQILDVYGPDGDG